MRDQAEIVVIGGGIYGTNIAYHLAKLGKKDIVLLEKGEIASGESSHAAGVVTQFATSKAMMEFRKYSIELYSSLGLFNHVGSLRVASSPEQLKELERSGAIRIEDRRIHIADPATLSQWTQPY